MKILAIVFAACLSGTICISQSELEREIAQIIEETTLHMEALIDRTGDPKPSNKEKANKKVLAGIKAHEQGQYHEAIKNYQKAIKLDPLNGAAYYEMAFSYSLLGEQRNALKAAVKAQVLAPKLEQVYVVKANILDDLGLNDMAICEYKRLIDIQPNSLMGYINLGVSQRRAKDLDGARESFNKAIEIEPTHPSAYLHLAVLAQSLGHHYEEQSYLEEFVKYGQNDRRLEMVEKRLAELNNSTITVNPEAAYVHIELAVAMQRELWKMDKHKQIFPDAKGYFPSIEEERDVAATTLQLWKEQKKNDPDAKHPFYDYLLQAETDNQLEPFIYFVSRERIPDGSSAYFEQFPEAKASFEEWATRVGLISEKQETEDEPKEEVSFSVVELATLFLQESETLYEIGTVETQESDQFRDREAKRFRDQLRLTGGNEVSKKAFKRIIEKLGRHQEIEPILDAFQYALPNDKEWASLVNQLSRYNRELVEIPFPNPIPGALGDPSTQIHLDMNPDSLSFLSYWIAKSAFQNEPRYREMLGHPQRESNPTVFEEYQAVTAAIQGYLKSKEQEDFSGPNECFEFLVAVYRENCVEGFVLFEIIHKYYGVRLKKLTDKQTRAFREYMLRFATKTFT